MLLISSVMQQIDLKASFSSCLFLDQDQLTDAAAASLSRFFLPGIERHAPQNGRILALLLLSSVA